MTHSLWLGSPFVLLLLLLLLFCCFCINLLWTDIKNNTALYFQVSDLVGSQEPLEESHWADDLNSWQHIRVDPHLLTHSDLARVVISTSSDTLATAFAFFCMTCSMRLCYRTMRGMMALCAVWLHYGQAVWLFIMTVICVCVCCMAARLFECAVWLHCIMVLHDCKLHCITIRVLYDCRMT